MADIRVSDSTLSISGDFTSSEIADAQTEVFRILRRQRVSQLDPSAIERIDSAGTALWEEIVIRASKQGPVTIVPARPEVQTVMDTFRSLDLELVPKPILPGYFERTGAEVIEAFRGFGAAVFLASEVFYWSIVGIFSHKSQRKGSLTLQCIRLGQNAIPIIALLSFIIGFIISLQAAVQMKNYGAGVFLADLLSFTMVRELGPLLTAIIVAGRSGSAIASEIATMQVSEEIDALKMMALNPIRYIVVPFFHAITLMMPILVTFSILLGEIGGAFIGLGYLNLSLATFVNRSIEVLSITDLLITFIKSTVFAWLIVIIGSHYGFRVRGGAEGVGKATTSSVVSSIFAVIIADAIFSLLYL